MCHQVHSAPCPGPARVPAPWTSLRQMPREERQGWPPILTPCCGCQPPVHPLALGWGGPQGFGGIRATAAGLQSWSVLRRRCRCPLSHLTHILPFNYTSRFPKAMPGTVQSASWQRRVTRGAGALPQRPPPLYCRSPALVLFIYYRF